MLLQILESNAGSSHFYTNINLGPQEDAATITDRILAEFKKDDIYSIIKSRTIAFTSDSAAVVAGVRDGVGKRLEVSPSLLLVSKASTVISQLTCFCDSQMSAFIEFHAMHEITYLRKKCS